MGEGGNFSYLRKIVHLSAPHRSEAIRYAHPAKGGLLWKLDYRASPPSGRTCGLPLPLIAGSYPTWGCPSSY